MSAESCRKRFFRQRPHQRKRILTQRPAVKITSTEVPANSSAMFVPLVITVRLRNCLHARAIAVVVVPESRIMTCPS